jgi:hypothetical protein
MPCARVTNKHGNRWLGRPRNRIEAELSVNWLARYRITGLPKDILARVKLPYNPIRLRIHGELISAGV